MAYCWIAVSKASFSRQCGSQLQAAFVQLGDVVDDGVEALHLVALAVGQVVDQRVAQALAVWAGDRALKCLRLAAQRCLDVLPAGLEHRGAKQVAHLASGEGLGIDAEPGLVSPVGNAVVEVSVPVADHGGHGVEHRTKVMAGGFQRGLAVLQRLGHGVEALRERAELIRR